MNVMMKPSHGMVLVLAICFSGGLSAVGDDAPSAKESTKKEFRVEVRQVESSSEEQRDGEAPVQKILRSGKMVIIGPDGKRREISLPGTDDDGKPAPLAENKVKKPMIGVSLTEVSPELASHLKLDSGFGALVGQVLEDGPAARAGLKKYDVITHINDQAVIGVRPLQMLIEKSVGKSVKLKIIRGGQPQDVEVQVEELETQAGFEPLIPDLGGRLQLPDEVLKQLEEAGVSADAITLFGPGIQIPPIKANPSPDVSELSKEIQALRQELQELKKSLKK